MVMEHYPEQQSNQQRGLVPPASIPSPMSLMEKTGYALGAGIPVTLLLELGLRAEFPGLLLAILLGGAAGYFSEEIREGIIDKLPVPQGYSGSRMSRLAWWFEGGSQRETLSQRTQVGGEVAEREIVEETAW